MKKLGLLTTLFLLCVSIASAQRNPLSNYYPVQNHNYDYIRLLPRPAVGAPGTACGYIGTMYVESPDTVRYCADDGSGNPIWNLIPGVWRQDFNVDTDPIIYPTADPLTLKAGIGLTSGINDKLVIRSATQNNALLPSTAIRGLTIESNFAGAQLIAPDSATNMSHVILSQADVVGDNHHWMLNHWGTNQNHEFTIRHATTSGSYTTPDSIGTDLFLLSTDGRFSNFKINDYYQMFIQGDPGTFWDEVNWDSGRWQWGAWCGSSNPGSCNNSLPPESAWNVFNGGNATIASDQATIALIGQDEGGGDEFSSTFMLSEVAEEDTGGTVSEDDFVDTWAFFRGTVGAGGSKFHLGYSSEIDVGESADGYWANPEIAGAENRMSKIILTIDPNNNGVGINMKNPDPGLHVRGEIIGLETAVPHLRLLDGTLSSGNYDWELTTSANDYLAIVTNRNDPANFNKDVMRLYDVNSRVAIGILTPKNRLHIAGSLEMSSNDADLYFFENEAVNDAFFRFHLDNGSLTIEDDDETDGTIGDFSPSPSNRWRLFYTTDNIPRVEVGDPPAAPTQANVAYFVNGDIYVNGSATASSRNIKNNIEPLAVEDALKATMALEPVQFVYNNDPKQDPRLGFIAEDVPDLVATSNRKTLTSMDIISTLTRTVQYQQQKIEQQQEQIESIKNKIDELRKN